MTKPGEVTRFFEDWRRGEEAAFDQLLLLVYDKLRRIARGCCR